MSPIKVGDRVRWDGEGYEVVLAVTSTHAFVVYAAGCHVYRAPLSELTLVESAPVKEPDGSAAYLAKVQRLEIERASLQVENARLREALQAMVNHVDYMTRDSDKLGPIFKAEAEFLAAAAALGIRPKETP